MMIGDNPLAKGRLLIDGDVLVEFDRYRQRRSRDSESGGLLLGYRRGQHLHVTSITGPQSSDRATRVSFRRSCEGHAKIADDEWLSSGRRKDYLGEWHTHPEMRAMPSAIDKREWAKLLQGRDNALLFIILGTHEDWFGLGAGTEIRQVVFDQQGSVSLEPEGVLK